ncbi:centriolar and ciliogenesis-associated protein HYLS1 [Euwallacea fornicatus]|uniref:centriolar and ciliogenesis-associated protein HYLS1 n=1 Tax=Euwallacea fornicatus TaxID=995702 RepID=UPI00338E4E0D
MSEKIDAREVLSYLNELGYTNISSGQLKEFIKDLKKVIKYDSRYGEMSYNQSKNLEPSYCSTYSAGFNNNKLNITSESDKQLDKENIQPRNHNAKANKPSGTQREQHIAVHIFENRSQEQAHHEHCIHAENSKTNDKNLTEHKKKDTQIVEIDSSLRPATTESTVKSISGSNREPSQLQANNSQANKHIKSRATFIRPLISKPSVNKCDPVALYHYYQSQWKRTKIPGQDSRDDLRWAIRTRMLSGPKVEVKSKCNIPSCGWSR